MLQRFRVNNFRSLLNVEFRPAGLNLLIGPNNAGKTNLCAALRFLGLTSNGPLDLAALDSVGERWNLTNAHVSDTSRIELEADCLLRHDGTDLQFTYTLWIGTKKTDIAGAESLSVEKEQLVASGAAFHHTLLLENLAGRLRMLDEEVFLQNPSAPPVYTQARTSSKATLLSQVLALGYNPRSVLFRSYLKSWAYYNLSPNALRSPEVAKEEPTLLADGANLSRALFAWHNEKPRLERKLIEMVRQVEPTLDLFSYSSPDPEHVHLFVEDAKEHRFSARAISDGTLRFLGSAFIVLSAAQNSTSGGYYPLLMIEEPENGLYVGQLKPLIERIDPTGKGGQFIFTSHSPYFIDLFDNNLEGIHVVKPGLPSSVLRQPDPDKIHRLLKDMSLGELHFRELLA